MANVNYVDNSNTHRAGIFHDCSGALSRYYENALRDAEAYGSKTADKIRRVQDRAFEKIDKRKASKSYNKERQRGRSNSLRQYTSIDDFIQASPAMMDYIMSNVEIKSRFQRGRCAGYEDDWAVKSTNRTTLGNTDPFYRIVNNGVVTKKPSGEVSATTYRNTEVMDKYERGVVKMTLAELDLMLKQKKDPTSIYGADF